MSKVASNAADPIVNRAKKVSSILITQSRPPEANNPYATLENKFDVKVDFRSFIEVQGVEGKDFRKQKINILDFTAIVLTSKHAVDHFFRICKEMKQEMPAEMKYFCVSEGTANYLQKYITIRKRKLFVGAKSAQDLIEVLKKHKTEKYLFPCSNIRTPEIPDFFEKNGYTWKESVMYQTVHSDLSDLKEVKYDVLAFFSPSGVDSLLKNFPDFEQNGTRIAAFGPTTAKAVLDAGLLLDIQAPMPNAPSMTGALEVYIQQVNKAK
ncbi:MAG: uroporphyrinogen-III synthase [Flexibacteraceae bacterium]|jgi:uroporphyrinogen-III synthase